VKVNCAALVETLLLSELFGHEKGSFTGAVARRRGRFEVAEGGTLFLDEIGDISPRTQMALLRVLQDKTFERIGGVTPLRANVRVVCATHRDLRAMVARGEFREDLYYRLRGVVLEVPALRQRMSDLPLIADAVLDRIASDRGEAPKRLSGRALEALSGHEWRGNIRELENTLRAAALFADAQVIELDDLVRNVDGFGHLAASVAPSRPAVDVIEVESDRPSATQRRACPADRSDADLDLPSGDAGGDVDADADRASTAVAYAEVRAGTSLGDLKRNIEYACIKRALADTNGNITRAASLLGMKRPRLSQLVKAYGLGSGSED
jgi:sigma-54 specific flagellar transcriptional regulator A